MTRTLAWVAAAGVAAASCGRQRVLIGGARADRADAAGENADRGQAGPDGGVHWDGGGPLCGASTLLPYDPKTPDVLIAFDHSGSMAERFGTGTRLSVEQAILRDLVLRYQSRIRFGYLEFPMNTSIADCPTGPCCAGPVAVEPGFRSFDAINRAMLPCGGAPSCSSARTNTPTADALRVARDFYRRFADGFAERYVLLSTDGEPNCVLEGTTGDPCGQAEQLVADLDALGVKTIVLGVSEEVAASACLERLGAAGGAPRTGATSFYPAADPEALEGFLSEIIAGLATPSCSVDLEEAPPDPSRVALFFDAAEVPWDGTRSDGWDYALGSTERLEVFGPWCAKLQAAAVTSVEVRFGCPPCQGTACG